MPASILAPQVEEEEEGQKKIGAARALELREMRMARWQRTREKLLLVRPSGLLPPLPPGSARPASGRGVGTSPW